LSLPLVLLRNLASGKKTAESSDDVASCLFYEGIVTHIRKAPVQHKFKYRVRTALINLDSAPSWFQAQAFDHMTAEQARKFAGTDGTVLLLTNPTAAGYTQNPISVYYCYSSKGGSLQRCIAEVTNTPWNERVTFVFDASGAAVRKALHVSPLMDMKGTWQLEAPDPLSHPSLKLVVRVQHPEYGPFFHADLIGVRSSSAPGCRNEEAGWGVLLRYGFLPHRIAMWIYWQALLLLWKGLPLYSPPEPEVKAAAALGARHPCNGVDGKPFVWRRAPHWPWNAGPGSGCPVL